MKLAQLSVASILACLVGLVALGGFSVYGLQQIRDKQDQVAGLLSLQKRIDDISVTSDRFLLYRPDPEAWRAYRANIESARRQLLAYEDSSVSAQQALHHLEVIVAELDAILDEEEIRAAPAETGVGPLGIPEQAREVMSRIASHGAALDTELDRLLRQRQELIAREAIWITAGFGGAALLFGAICILAFSLIYRRIGGPARGLEQTFLRLAAGDRNARVPVAGDDEFAQLAHTFNSMLDQRRQAEERLHEYRTLVEGSRDLCAAFDADHRFLLMNRAYVNAYGLDPDTVVGQHVRDVFGNEFYEREVRQRLDRVLAGETIEFETERDYRDRGHCQVLIRYYPIAAENGRIERVGAIVTDITALKQAEAELQEQARLLDMAGHIGRFGGWAVDLPGKRVEWSDVVAKIHGMPPGYSPTVEEGIGFYAPECRERIRECFTACTERGIPFDEELQIVTANGERRWVRSVAAPVRDEGNRTVRVEGAFQDITERKLAERETEQLNQRLVTMLDSITEGFLAIDREWRYTHANAAGARMVEQTVENLRGTLVWEQFPELADTNMGQGLQQAMEMRVPVSVEEYYPPLQKWFDVRAYPTEEGGLAVFFRDVTEIKQTEFELREQARLLDMAGRAARFGGWSADLVTGRIVLSKVAAEIRGLQDEGEQSIEEGLALYTPEWRDFIWQKFQTCATDGMPYDEEAEIVNVDGRRAWVRVVGEPVYDDDAGRVIRVEGAFQDITDRKKSEREAQRLTERLRTTLESITDAFFTLDRDWRFSYINAEAERVLERDRDALLDQIVWEAFPDVAGTRIMHEYRRAMDEGVAVALEEYYPPLAKWFDIRVYPSEEGLAVFFRDITEQREMVERLREHEQELRRIVDEDPVTRALTRHGFVEAFRQRRETSGWDPEALVVMLDIEGQRDINDAHGYEIGDRVLGLIVERLRERAGAGGLVARSGGDEFAVYLPGRGEGQEQPRQVLASAFDEPFRVDELPIEAEARFGYTCLGHQPRDAESLLREAELALYEVRIHSGRNWGAYTAALDQVAHARIEMVRELRRALDEGQFELHFQPKVTLADGRVVGTEALLRWFHPERGLISPGEFIPVAEQSQLMAPIGDWALFEACSHLREWQDAGLDVVRVAVNVSVVQFRVGHFVDKVREAIAVHGIEPAGLTLEITESVFERESTMLQDQLRELHDMGVRLSLDDFGTGYSSLLYLQQYPFDEIKVDQGFVQRILDDPYSRKIVTTVLGIAGALGADAVAEGIESREVCDALLEMGCRLGQGYYYSVPLAVEDFRWLLEKKSLLPPAAALRQRQDS